MDELGTDTDDGAQLPADRQGAEDPRAQWRALPPPIPPESWTAEQAAEPVPGSVESAEANRLLREARAMIERGAAG